ncbi:MAG: tRNA (N6-isopentenyl adenosine(37)-C2)-methylthiotransferase MiaB [Bacteroidales bacterium]|nr:tRNA (N6-isopentenyl adenosine(37)-C2)-methylthiotransferase MiaB [Bacteroidales bacterium]
MPRKLYIETYGCQMNVADSEVVVSILGDNGYTLTDNMENADLILVNTCSIRDNAEQRVWGRLDLFKHHKRENPGTMIGIIGCMAERLKEQLLETDRMVDIVAGPDSYRDLPRLVDEAWEGQKAVNVLLSREETYADIDPVRSDRNGVSSFVSIMRGCNNMCSYCVVPYVRGAERSRDPQTIINEVKELFSRGYREVTLLGQNVNSYSREDKDNKISFARLLEMTAATDPELRVRFSTSHPKDISDELLKVMAENDNICKHIHLPVQSGSSRILDLMNRKYDREWYMDRIRAIRKFLPSCSLSSDMITGFCTETEDDHRQTLSLMNWAKYDFAYMFKYSERPDTLAARKLEDDVPEEIKTRRLNEIIELQNRLSLESKRKDLGKTFEVLVEGFSKKSKNDLSGRTSQNKVVVFPSNGSKAGDYVKVKITDCTAATLLGEAICPDIRH